jgi:hypothetical protein
MPSAPADPSLRPNIFVSYSHADSALVAPVVSLLRASQATVFRDADGIRPGKKWQDELDAAILDASIVVVFWCHHAQSSGEVLKEFTVAIAQGKDVLPILIDDTPLPSDLTQFQYIDFRDLLKKAHVIDAPLSPSQGSSNKSSSSTVWRGALGLTVLLSGLVSLNWLWFRPEATTPDPSAQRPADAHPPLGSRPPDAHPPLPSQPPDALPSIPSRPPDATDHTSMFGFSDLLLLLFVALLVGTSYLVVRRLRRRVDVNRQVPSEAGKTGKLDIEANALVAERIEQEIARRTRQRT